MPIRNWSPQDLKRWWLRGAAWEGVLIAAGALVVLLSLRQPSALPPRSIPPPPSANSLTPDERAQVMAQMRPLLESLGIAMTMAGDSSITFGFTDSETITLITRHDTIHSIRLSPAAERAVGQAVGPIFQGLSEAIGAAVWQVVIVLAAIYLPIPVGLTALTLYWAVARRYVSTPAV